MIRWARELQPADCSSILLGLLLAPVIVFVVVSPVLIDQRPPPYESRAIGALKTISTAQSVFREGDKDGNNTLDYAPNLRALEEADLIEPVLGSGVKMGYRFCVQRGEETEFVWAATAEPVTPGKTGDRWLGQRRPEPKGACGALLPCPRCPSPRPWLASTGFWLSSGTRRVWRSGDR